MLGITRERVRQLEKSVITRLKATAEQGTVPHINDFQSQVLELLEASGQAARISDRTAFFFQGYLIEVGATQKLFTTPTKKQTEDYITGRFG